MAAMNVFGAETDEAGAVLMSSAQQQFLALRRGHPGPLPPPVASMAGRWSEAERLGVEQALACSAVGSPASVERAIAAFIERTGVDEIDRPCGLQPDVPVQPDPLRPGQG